MTEIPVQGATYNMKDSADRPVPQRSGGAADGRSFWRSRSGLYLVVALAASGLLLGYEYRAVILASGLIIWLPLLLCVGMHFFMHGRHGGHGDKGGD